ncbi:TonB-dependent receptor [Bermanella marisrubri]|nr:TonB-dependent receptor [Bermanella marisrubri]
MANEAPTNETEQPAKQHETKLNMVKVVGKATSGIDDLIDREMLDNVQANDLSDVFSLNPEISAGGSVAMAQKIYVRNIGEDMLNISVDGAEQAGAVFHHASRVVIEPDLLKQVEVEAGAGSATAGFGALGGAVRFVTKDPIDLLRGNESAGASIKSTYYSNGESFKHSATAYAQDEKSGLGGLVNYISADLNNREDGDGNKLLGSESENEVLFAKGVAQISDEQKISISAESLTQEGDIAYRPEWIPSNFNPTTPTKAERETFILNYQFDSYNPLLDLSVNAYTTSVEQERDRTSDWGVVVKAMVETTSVSIENKSDIGFSQLIYGVNYREDSAELYEYGTEDGEVAGAYLQSILKLGENTTVSTGLRYDDYSLNDVNGLNISDSGVSPNLSANYSITPEISISAGYAEAMRGATVKDAYLLEAGGKYFNDPNLKAEKAKNTEIAIDYSSGILNASFGAYQSNIEDALVSSAPWKEDITNSDDDIEVDGYFAKMGIQENAFDISASLHISEAKQAGTNVIRYVQGSNASTIGDTLVINSNYRFNPDLTIGWLAQIVDDIKPFTVPVGAETLTVEKQGYSTHDLYLSWSPLRNRMLLLNLTMKNVFDETYLSHSSPEDLQANPGYEGIAGSLDPGRDVRLSATIKF